MDSEPARVGSSVKTPDKHVIWSVRGRARRRQYADEPVRDTLYLHRRMPRRARVHLLSLRSSLVNLPISIYGPLLERNIRPQHVAVLLTCTSPALSISSKQPSAVNRVDAYVGWTGMLSASSLAHFNAVDRTENLETVEIDPQYAQGLGLSQGDIVR